MSEVKIIGWFDPASKSLWQSRMVALPDVVGAVLKSDFDAAQSELAASRSREQALLNSIETANADLAALREELAREQRYVEINANSAHGKHKEGQKYRDERDDLQQRLAGAERRNATLETLLKECGDCVRNGEDFDLPVTTMARIDAILNKPEEAKSPKVCIECDQPYCHGVCVERGDKDYDKEAASHDE